MNIFATRYWHLTEYILGSASHRQISDTTKTANVFIQTFLGNKKEALKALKECENDMLEYFNRTKSSPIKLPIAVKKYRAECKSRLKEVRKILKTL